MRVDVPIRQHADYLRTLLIDTMWPARCALCQELLHGRDRDLLERREFVALHSRCVRSLPRCSNAVAGPRRLRDGAPLVACFADDARFFQLLHACKYGGRSKLLRPLASHLVQAARRAGCLPPGAILVPLPDDARRRRQRGFSPTGELGRALHALTGLSLRSDLLHRRAGGTAQASLQEAASRRDNQAELWVSGRIDAIASEVPLILIEDQITTGATAAAALRRLGSRGHPVACVALGIAAAAPRVVVA